MLCGLAFYRQTELVIDFPQCVILLKGSTVQQRFHENISGATTTAKVYCAEEVKLLPFSEVVITIWSAAEGVHQVKPLQGTEAEQPALTRTFTLLTDGIRIVRAANPTPRPLLVSRGAAIGKAASICNTTRRTAFCKTAA